MCICFSILLPSKAFPHLNILSNCRLPCCDIYIYLYIHIVVSMPGYTYSVFRSHFWRSLLLLLLMCSCFFFFFFNAHLWDLGTPRMDGKGFIAHHRKWGVVEVACTQNVHAIEFQNFSPSPSRVLWGKHCLQGRFTEGINLWKYLWCHDKCAANHCVFSWRKIPDSLKCTDLASAVCPIKA